MIKTHIIRSAKSRTMIASVLISISGVIMASSDFLKTVMTPDVFGYVMLGIGIVVAWLRVLTTKPLSDK